MSHYIHQVPGRIRVRSRAFRCSPDRARAAERRLTAMDGVQNVRVNPRAGSITVHYDTEVLRQSDLLATLEQSGCMAVTMRSDEGLRKAADTFGKALVGAVVKTAVERSARTLVGALI